MIDTTTYKEALEADLRAITTELGTLGIHNPNNENDWIATPEQRNTKEADPNVSADRTEDWTERRAAMAPLETRYKNIKRALKKIETGTYGICEISGADIEADRLQAHPAARTCKAHLHEEANLPL